MGKERDSFFKAQPRVSGYEPVETVTIGGRIVGKGQPAFIIAEVSANHRGDINVALRAIDSAAGAGADAVKFQHLTGTKIAADTVIYDEWHGKAIGPLSGFYKSAELPNEWTDKLVAHARKRGIMFLSTPHDIEAVEILHKAGVHAYKVASYEMTDDILLRYIAKKGKPIILSTGMAYLEEVAHAVRVIQEEGNREIVVLHCVSIYPPKFRELNLRAITTLQEALKLPIGYSDHSAPPYSAAPVAAVTLGACMIEKHVTDTRSGESNDAPNSLEPSEFKRMIEEIRAAEAALAGSGIKQPVSRKNHQGDEIFDRFARRSLYAARDLKAGETLTAEMVTTLRPWGGIAPKDIGLFLGKKLAHDVAARAPLTPETFFN
jgi:sialic acid synthase SpsE